MTIVFQGHIERVELGADNKLNVYVRTAVAECGQIVVLHPPREASTHWTPGRAVNFTVYAYGDHLPAATMGTTGLPE